MRAKIRGTKAAVDDDITDDVTVDADGNVIMGAGRDAAAAASKARKAPLCLRRGRQPPQRGSLTDR